MERCDQCGFVYGSVAVASVPVAVRSLPARYAVELRTADGEGLARARPEPATWSALEYTCHVRDVFRFQRERLELALAEDRPAFASMRRDERAVEERYNDQAIDTVLDQLAGTAERFAVRAEAIEGEQWRRTGIYPWPEPTERTLEWVARHTLHEAVHHLEDVVTGVRALRAARESR